MKVMPWAYIDGEIPPGRDIRDAYLRSSGSGAPRRTPSHVRVIHNLYMGTVCARSVWVA